MNARAGGALARDINMKAKDRESVAFGSLTPDKLAREHGTIQLYAPAIYRFYASILRSRGRG
jgi:hypothetical protein